MLSLALALALNMGPTMTGPPLVAAHGSPAVVDYTVSMYLTGPAVGSQCTNAAITTDQAGAVTIARASTSYCQKSDLSYVLIDANKAVVEGEGLRIEPASSNRVAYSDAIDVNWTPTDAEVSDPAPQPGPFGSVNDIQTTSSGGRYESPSFTITGTSAVLSAWASNLGGATATLVLRDTTAGADRCTISVTSGTAFPTTMAGRQSCSASATVVSGNTHVVRAYPGGAAGTGAGYYVTGVAVEPARTVMTSHIPTSGTAASRAADAVTTTITDVSVTGCFGATAYATDPAFPQRIASKASDLLAYNGTTTFFTNDGTNTVNSTAVANMTGRSVPLRVQWGGSAMRIDVDGNTGTPGSFDGAHGSGTTLYLGSNAGVQQLQGWLKKIKLSSSTAGCTP